MVGWEAQEGEEFFARFFQAVGDRTAAQPPFAQKGVRSV